MKHWTEASLVETLPVRAWLRRVDGLDPKEPARWVLETEWAALVEGPTPTGMTLRLISMCGVRCCALIELREARCTIGGREAAERAVVYLLSPAEPTVWNAIANWVDMGCVSKRSATADEHCVSLTADCEVFDLRYAEGEELESDMLAGVLRELFVSGTLDAEVSPQLGFVTPAYCAVVGTPMLCQSLRPVEPEALAEHELHQEFVWRSQGIWS